MLLRKLFKFFLPIVLLLLLLRLALPYALIYYAENRINKIPEYHATIATIDMHLYRGSYTIKKVVFNKINENIPVPFFSAEKIDLSIEWPALFHGRLVGKITAEKPILNFVIEPSGKDEQLTVDKEWEYAVKALFPVNFNKITLKKGTINLQSFKGKPPFKLTLNDIDFAIENMQKVTDKTSLYSTFKGQAQMNKGVFTIDGRVNPYAREPTFLLKSTLQSMQIQGANDFLLHFTNIDVSKGNFSLFTEIAAAKGKIHGYAKPIIKNLQIFDPQEKVTPIEFLYKGLLEVGAKVLTNQKKQTLATKVKIEGNIEKPDVSMLSIVGYILSHAFIHALLPQIDHSIELKDIYLNY